MTTKANTTYNIYNTPNMDDALDLLDEIEERLSYDDRELEIMGTRGFVGIDISTGATGDHSHNWDGARVAIDENGIIYIHEMWNGGATGQRTEITGKTTIDMIIAIINNYL